METSAESYVPSPFYSRLAWIGLAAALVCGLFGLRVPFAFIPCTLCCLTSILMFLLAWQSPIFVGDDQLTIGTRAIAWREIREINSARMLSPLVLRLHLTNKRKKFLIYPGDPERISRLLYQLRKNSTHATFDGVSYKDYWTWSSLGMLHGSSQIGEQPVRMINPEDEDEIERMYRQLKSVGRLDSRTTTETDETDFV